MLTTVIIILLALALFGYVALPLINPRGADPLPLERDPVTTDLQEEKAALFRAIRELEARDDLAEARREQLRARYEAKAARVLRALDERERQTPPVRAMGKRQRAKIPYGALAMLGAAVVIATTLSTYVLPRVGDNATVTSFFAEDLEGARALRDARRAAERDPSAQNLLELANTYWRLDDAQGAQEAYLRAVNEADAQSALAFRRLGFLSLQSDLNVALEYLERSRELEPDDLDTLFTLGEIHFAQGDIAAASEAWEAFREAPGGAQDPQVEARLQLAEELAPLAQRVEENPSQENLLAMANVLWNFDERSRAVEVYFRVLTEYDPNDPTALGRTGQLMFLSGRNDDAITLMERAALSPQVDPQTLLFLGNAYFSAQRYAGAVAVWERHVEIVGEEAAGRVPALIEEARAQLSGEGVPGLRAAGEETSAGNTEGPGGEGAAEASNTADAVAGGDVTGGVAGRDPSAAAKVPEDEGPGATVFAQNCAGCHGPQGEGGAGPRLTGNSRAVNEQNVSNAVRFGRGMMPGFSAVLSQQEIEAVVAYVTEQLALDRQ